MEDMYILSQFVSGSSLGSSNIREYDLRYRKKSIKLKIW